MFIDEALVSLKAGDGGNGCISFRKEKYVPKGGPDGGDGGHGGDIIFVASNDLQTLLDFKYIHIFKSDDGEHGLGSKMYGKNGAHLKIKVPVGTQIINPKTGKMVCDLDENGKEFIAAKGGAGGRGNMKFTNATRHAPRYSELGAIGEECELKLVLKLIADIGLVGFPNAGKSTILSKVSKATPKIADYPFTTLSPNLGVASLGFSKTIVVADIPGIIEGAHAGVGLGNKFLKHIERTRGLVFVLDMTGFERPDPLADLKILYSELKQFSSVLVKKPFFIAANKMDIPDSREIFNDFKKRLKRLKTFKDAHLVEISGLTGLHVDALLKEMYSLKLRSEEIDNREKAAAQEAEAASSTVEITDESDSGELKSLGTTFEDAQNIQKRHVRQKVQVQKVGKGEYKLLCPELETAVSRVNFKADDAIYYFRNILKKFLVDKALKKAGAREGDTVYIQDFVFDFQNE